MLSSITAIVPLLCVTAAGIAAMLAEAFREPGERMPIAGLGLVGLVGAGISTALLWGRHETGFGVVAADTFGLFFVMILVVIGVMTMLLSPRLVERDELPGGEYYALTLFALAGMMLMAMATDLLVIFLALEVMSLAVYVLTALKRTSEASVEGAFKYFILGGFSSAFFLYGIAFVYGLAQTTRLEGVGQVVAAQAGGHPVLALVALGLLLVGFGFKVSAVPFHMWTPDAYEGAPTIVSGFMSTGVKAAAFAAFVRVMATAFHPLQATWYPVFWGLAAVTMVLGTVVGVAQTNLKRMLAYSSIAHAGYLLVGLTAANDVGRGAILFYLLTYGVTNLAAFAVIGLLGDARPSQRRPGEHGRPVEPAPGAGGRVLGAAAVARRDPADRGIRGKVVHLQRGRTLGRLPARDHRRPDERRVDLLLPARHRHDVHGGARRRAALARAVTRRDVHAGGDGRRHLLPRDPAVAVPRPRGAVDWEPVLTCFSLQPVVSEPSRSARPPDSRLSTELARGSLLPVHPPPRAPS